MASDVIQQSRGGESLRKKFVQEMEINNFSAVSRQKQQQQVLARNRRSDGLLVLRDLQKFGFPDSKCELFIFFAIGCAHRHGDKVVYASLPIKKHQRG